MRPTPIRGDDGRILRYVLTVRADDGKRKTINAARAALECRNGAPIDDGYCVCLIEATEDFSPRNVYLATVARPPNPASDGRRPPLIGKLRIRPETAIKIRTSKGAPEKVGEEFGVSPSTVRRIRGMTDGEFRRYRKSLARLWELKKKWEDDE